MGEILLAGTTHYPLLLYTDNAMTSQMERHWKSDRVPDWWKDQKNWPKEMQEEYGPDGFNGLASAVAHRQRLVEGFRKVREEIEAFNPDFVLIGGMTNTRTSARTWSLHSAFTSATSSRPSPFVNGGSIPMGPKSSTCGAKTAITYSHTTGTRRLQST
jgi:hypothetical protein